MLLALVQSELKRLEGTSIPGGTISAVRVFFTGPSTDNGFAIRNYYITDKHGLRHACYNAKLDIETANKQSYAFGLLDKDLDKFDAQSDPSEDIIIRIQ
jgi:hypothetical protein